LETAGYVVLATSDVQQALDLFENRSQSIDLLLTDINMPQIDGLELACRVSEIAPHLPVMFMTGCRADSAGIECLIREGASSDCKVIRKPFTSPELLGEVSGILSTAPP
jgi:two-component system cell cycle response regulator CpdR